MARKITPTHVLLNQIELSSSASSVTFSNIPQGYGDLVFTISGKLIASQSDTVLRLNQDSGSNYSRVYLSAGTSSSSSSSNTSTGFWPFYLGTSSAVCTGQLMDYSATDKHTTFLSHQSWSGTALSIQAQRWANTAAVNHMEFITTSDYAAGTIFSLYGVYA